MQRPTAWVDHANVFVGLWLAASPFSFGYWRSPEGWSDVAAGALVVAFSLAAMLHDARWRWATGAVATWVLFAPILLLEPPLAMFVTDTWAGLAVFGLALMVPGAPDERERRAEGRDLPPGWSYNPSSWDQRIVPVVFALLAAVVARGLAAYQLGYVPAAFDPFFGDGTERVLDSGVSKAFIVSDAALGMVSYFLDALAGLVGGTRRWATMPWIVILFGILVVPLGIVGITLVILQPVVVGAWCTGCLMTALLSLLMIPYAVDEVGASVQFTMRATRQGQGFWRTMWDGGRLAYEEMPPPDPRGSGAGVSYGWSLLAMAALGAAVMALPAFTGAGGIAAHSAHVAGPIVIAFAVIALAEVARAARFANVLAGLWIAGSAWLLPGASEPFAWASTLIGVAVVALSFPRGPVKGRYGVLQRYIV